MAALTASRSGEGPTVGDGVGVCDWLGGIVAVDVGLGTSATGDGETRGTAVAVGETTGIAVAVGEVGVTAAAVGATGATAAAVGATGEGEGSASQAKAAKVESMHNSVSRNGHPTIYKKVVEGI